MYYFALKITVLGELINTRKYAFTSGPKHSCILVRKCSVLTADGEELNHLRYQEDPKVRSRKPSHTANVACQSSTSAENFLHWSQRGATSRNSSGVRKHPSTSPSSLRLGRDPLASAPTASLPAPAAAQGSVAGRGHPLPSLALLSPPPLSPNTQTASSDRDFSSSQRPRGSAPSPPHPALGECLRSAIPPC